MYDKTEAIEDYENLLREICKHLTCSVIEMDEAIQKLAKAFDGFTECVELTIKQIAEILTSDVGLPIRNIISAGYHPEDIATAYMKLINYYPETFEIGDDMALYLTDTRKLKKRQKSTFIPIEPHNNIKYKTTKGFARKPVWNRTRSNPKLR